MLAMFGMTPRRATVTHGLATLISGVPLGSPVIVPLSVRVRGVPASRAANRGTPWKVMALPTWKFPAPASRRVPDAMVTVPVPSGPPSRPLPPWVGVLLALTMMPPSLTVSPPVNSLAPESCSKPLPVLVTDTEVPVRIDEMWSEGKTSVRIDDEPGAFTPSMSKVLAPGVRMIRPLETSETR